MSCLAVAALAPAVALGQESPPPISAVDVYVEMIPTSSGDVPVGAAGAAPPEGSPATPAPLPEAAAAELRESGGSDAPLLEAIATEPALGAPERVQPAEVDELETETTALGDFAPTVTEGDSRVLWLLAALALISVAFAAAAVRGRRASRRSPR